MGLLDATMKQILIIDDDEKLGQLLTQYLERYDMNAHVALTPSKGFELLKKIKPDLLILDVMLPEKDGFEVCREIRAKSSIYGQLPILMLTAHAEVTDRIVGLELGADDYLPKPFEPRELVARIDAILRRGRPSTETWSFGGLTVDPSRRSATMDGEAIPLTTAEFDLLELLIKGRGRVLSRGHILDGVRGEAWDAMDRSIDVLVSRLRTKLGDDPRQPRYVRTVRGAGYAFVGAPDDDV
jgi:DNA-binding response OmpR family regulator